VCPQIGRYPHPRCRGNPAEGHYSPSTYPGDGSPSAISSRQSEANASSQIRRPTQTTHYRSVTTSEVQPNRGRGRKCKSSHDFCCSCGQRGYYPSNTDGERQTTQGLPETYSQSTSRRDELQRLESMSECFEESSKSQISILFQTTCRSNKGQRP